MQCNRSKVNFSIFAQALNTALFVPEITRDRYISPDVITDDLRLKKISRKSMTHLKKNNVLYIYVTVYAETNHMLLKLISRYGRRQVKTANYNEFHFSPK